MNYRYMVFSGDYYYPDGGIHDYKGSFLSIADALHFIIKECTMRRHDWAQIVDKQTMIMVESYHDIKNKSNWDE